MILFLFVGLAANTLNGQSGDRLNRLTAEEKAEGWQLLFDGNSTDHWRGYNMERFPDEVWVVEDGALVFRPKEGVSGGKDIITKETYRDFEFKIEWMIEKGGNSGIFHHVLEQPGVAIYWSGPEFQILDNINHPDADQGVDGNRKAGSLYDLIPADPQNTKPYGEWNSVKIVSKGPQVEYWQNGEKVVEFERWTAEWFEMLRNSKFQPHPSFGAVPEGHIGLQDHSDLVKFRNIKIRKL
ncbi:MAG: DUF1080 domain-containing protein [Balneolaceae bacterium]